MQRTAGWSLTEGKGARGMYTGIWAVIDRVVQILCWIAPFTFVYGLVFAIRDAVSGGERVVALGFLAAVSLLVIVAACVM